MLVKKNIHWSQLIGFTWMHILWLTLWGSSVVGAYVYLGWHWIGIPWLPVSVIGIAVSFFVGFKTDSSYDRLWEARKIWGAIVNTSRMWGSSVKHLINDSETLEIANSSDLSKIQETLIKRHIAWLYTLRSQLLEPAPWEHSQVGKSVGWLNRKRKERIKDLFKNKELTDVLKRYADSEYDQLKTLSNPAVHLLDKNSEELLSLRKRGMLSDYRHVQLQNLINDQYAEQGKCERIKKFPFPRQYATGSAYFIGIFILLLPFGMVTEFDQLAEEMIWLTVPFVTLIGWVFILMELIGDYSENPFEGLANDIPMMSICRGIEIDLLEMIGEKNIPLPIEAKKGLLM